MRGGDGTIVRKSQPLFKITPDERFTAVDPKAVERERRVRTSELLEAVLRTPGEKAPRAEELERDAPARLAHLRAV